ncbi:MAG: hypothetical protein JKY33_02365 [Bacteroidia bacterium]|nr:hypothetical protein [Bacteroidia bacterium]
MRSYLFLFLFISTASLSQVRFQKTIERQKTESQKHYTDWAKCISQTEDNGYLVLCTFGLLKLDSIANLQWIKNYKGSFIKKTPEKKYLLAGNTLGFDYFNMALLKEDGRAIWKNEYVASSSRIKIVSLKVTEDNHYLVAGWLGGYMFLFKANVEGYIAWTKVLNIRIGDIESKNELQIDEAADGSFFIAGKAFSIRGFTGRNLGYVINIGKYGWMNWLKIYEFETETGKRESLSLEFITATPDGGFVGTKGITLYKFNSKGESEWVRHAKFVPHTRQIKKFDLIETVNGGIAAMSRTQEYYSDIYMVKLDNKGNIYWARTFGGGGIEYGNFLLETNDKGFVIAGITKVGDKHSDIDVSSIYLSKTDENGNAGCTQTVMKRFAYKDADYKVISREFPRSFIINLELNQYSIIDRQKKDPTFGKRKEVDLKIVDLCGK